MRGLRNGIASVLLAGCGMFAAAFAPMVAVSQGVSGVDPYTNRVIERVTVRIVNPSADLGLNARVEDQIRTLVGLFPGERFSEERIAFQLSRVRRVRDVGDAGFDVSFGARGGLDITVNVTLGQTPAEAELYAAVLSQYHGAGGDPARKTL